MLSASNISKTYINRTLFSGLTLNVDDGDRMALIGPNGSGKTTLLDILAGDISPDTGGISRQRNVTIGYLRQESPIDRVNPIEKENEEETQPWQKNTWEKSTIDQMLARLQNEFTERGEDVNPEIDVEVPIESEEPNLLPTTPETPTPRYPSRTRSKPIEVDADQFCMFTRIALKATKHSEEGLLIPCPKGYKQAATGLHRKQWTRSMLSEYEAHLKNGTGELVSPESIMTKRGRIIGEDSIDEDGTKVYFIEGIWTYRIKMKAGKIEKFKSRWCANGMWMNCDQEVIDRLFVTIIPPSAVVMIFVG